MVKLLKMAIIEAIHSLRPGLPWIPCSKRYEGHCQRGTFPGTVRARQGPSGAFAPSGRLWKTMRFRERSCTSVPPAGIEPAT